MKIPPNKPHFFKPILPGFKNGLKIRIGFLKYLKGQEPIDHAILTRAGKKWLVKVHGRRLEEGNWKEFVEEHDLQLGDFLIFKHEGDMQFEVSIFDSTHCHREYPQQDEEVITTHDKPFGPSHFECIIRKYCLSRGFMALPQPFALANGLTNKKCWLILRDERQRSWNVKLRSNDTQSYIGDGWRKFVAENFLKEGDRIMFEIITNGETPIWKFRVVTDGETRIRKFQEKPRPNVIKMSNKTCSYAEAGTDEKPSHAQSHFECTIRQYCLSRGFLYVPKQFALANGLIDKKCNLTIRDEKQRLWNLKFCYWGTKVYIRDGWRKFAVDNCLKRGDRIMFEVVTNGETPVWKLQVVTNGETPSIQKFQDIMKEPSMSPLNAQASASTSSDDDHPYFVSTIKPYCISKSYLYLPLDFAKSNGLMDRKCEMILKDEAQRCWSVCLGRCSHHFGIINGWTKFRAANGIQVGDAYKFELIKNGKIPIAQFHCKFSGRVAKREEH